MYGTRLTGTGTPTGWGVNKAIHIAQERDWPSEEEMQCNDRERCSLAVPCRCEGDHDHPLVGPIVQ